MTDHKDNSGYYNSGNYNSGNYNSGDYNSGYWNSGDKNSGSWNSGDCNSGNYNSGDRNSGYYNSGDKNSGSWNSGDMNSGNRNSGYWNSGYDNSGSWNSGSWNSGDMNSGSWNTSTPETANFFNKPLSFDEWYAVSKPLWLSLPKPTFWDGGKLLKNDMEEEWKKALASASKEDVEQVVNLPNFDGEVFKEITGLEIGGEAPSCDGRTIVIEGEEYVLVKK